ncbi:MAG: proton-conducting transporter membrane subunit [Candidatus Omnitrophota bacterium]
MHYFSIDSLSAFVGFFICLFTVFIAVYSLGFMQQSKRLVGFFIYIFATLIVSLGAVFAGNLLVLMVFWGFLGLLLYLLIGFDQNPAALKTAKKTFIIVGGTDAIMIMGLALIWKLTRDLSLSQPGILLNSKLAVWAYLCLAAGAFAKAGVMPFHTWVPDAAEDAPIPVAAYLPACLDKLIGIYFFTRITIDLFVLDAKMSTFMMAIGSFTIIAAVMMALIQHDMKRLLGYHAVSQAGYMVLGIATLTPIGIAGGLFHMLNNAIYKYSLFLSAGSVQKKTSTTDLDKLGGIAKFMPITFACFLIASLAISGIPPLNGFASKWMIYQGVIETSRGSSGLWVLWLVAALFGSALTLASFMKLIHAVFLGQPTKINGSTSEVSQPQEVSVQMWLPNVILAVLCVVFGVFAYRIPLGLFIFSTIDKDVTFAGMWNASLATLLLIAGVAVGFVIYLMGSFQKMRQTDIFVGGEDAKQHPGMKISGVSFYDTVKDLPFIKVIYSAAKIKLFDIYAVLKNLILAGNRIFGHLHNGILPTYLAWC